MASPAAGSPASAARGADTGSASSDIFCDAPHTHHQHPLSVSDAPSSPPVPPSAAARIPVSLDSATPARRKPLSSPTSSLALATSLRSSAVPAPLAPASLEFFKPEQRFTRPLSVDSPTIDNFASSVRAPVSPFEPPTPLKAGASINTTGFAPHDARNIPSDDQAPPLPAELSDVLSEYDDLISEASGLAPDASRDPSPSNALDDSSDVESLYADDSNHNSSPPPMFAPKPIPPRLTLEKVDTSSLLTQHERQSNIESPYPDSARLSKPPLTKSSTQTQPSPLASLFGWAHLSPSVTDFSSILSPLFPTRNGSTDDALHADKHLSECPQTNVSKTNAINYCESYLCTPPPSQAVSSFQVEEMEEELKAISCELAASIRREMDLEDLVDRLQEQVNNSQAPSKRTSDYFSDSGYGSAKLSDHDQSKEEMEKIQRRSEQEKASIRLELTNKLQDERSRRKALDQQIKELAEKAPQMDLAQMNSLDANDRVKDLENTCEDLRRRLSEERQSKNNFEDLLAALKGQLQNACNERDNLRDEVVPQLRARVEGLESEAASYANLTYESTKMQQQLQSLQQENTTLRNSSAATHEEPAGLSRSNSVAASSFRPRAPPGLTRSDSVKNVQAESREQLAEWLKDVEAQRDALHSALKNLLERQEFQNRENQKKIRLLEDERQRLLTESPKKAGFERDIANLRTEINVLRRRAEEALEHKWQVEKGLVGLKMDLDRAEEEIASLRGLLEEKDILIPPSLAARPSSSSGVPITSESLEKAYRELQDAYRESLDRIKKLELDAGRGAPDKKTKLAMERLEQSLSAAVSERDAARRQLNGLWSQVQGLAAVESQSVAREKQLADELDESAQRVEQLAAQVRQQLSANAELRDRLADTVARGDVERLANSERISGLQERLHALEEQLVAAQMASEDRVGRHEEELSRLREAHNEQLRRINSGPGVGRTSGPKSPLLKSGVFARTSQAMAAKSFAEEVQMKTLRERVGELEKALADAENEIQQVVAKMSAAQIEVMNLQEERETAVRETRRLQKALADEQSKAFDQRFKTLNGMVAGAS